MNYKAYEKSILEYFKTLRDSDTFSTLIRLLITLLLFSTKVLNLKNFEVHSSLLEVCFSS